MRIKLDYGTTGLDIEVRDERTTVVAPVYRPPVPNPAAALVDALCNPTAGPPLRDIVPAGATVAISICDITRAQPRRLTLEALFAEMPYTRPDDIVILVATGTHRTNTPQELEEMLSPEILRDYRVVNHYARDDSSLVRVADTSTGVPVWLNREWVEADIRITTGFVEPHLFAGFSGGPKLVAPGLCGLETVMVLHNAPRIASPRAIWGVIEGNPIHEDIREIASATGVHFAIDVTLNTDKEIAEIFAGELLTEHAAACEAARRDAMQSVPERFDVVITTNSGYPLDQNLYQSVKGIKAAAQIAKKGGTIICAAECRDGLPSHGEYSEILTSRSSPAALLEMIHEPGYAVPDQWEVQDQAQIQMNHRVYVKNSYLSDEQLRMAHMLPTHDVAATAAEALKEAGPESTLCVLPNGPLTIPYIAE